MTCTCSFRQGKHAQACAVALPRIQAVRTALYHFGQGFRAGADPGRAHQRHTLDKNPVNHQHWARGFRDGRDACHAAEKVFQAELELLPEHSLETP